MNDLVCSVKYKVQAVSYYTAPHIFFETSIAATNRGVLISGSSSTRSKICSSACSILLGELFSIFFLLQTFRNHPVSLNTDLFTYVFMSNLFKYSLACSLRNEHRPISVANLNYRFRRNLLYSKFVTSPEH